MFSHKKSFVFSAINLNELFQERHDSIESTVTGETENYILNVGEEQYAQAVESKYSIADIVIDFDSGSIDSYEDDVPADCFPREFDVYQGKSYRKTIIEYTLEFHGNSDLLHYHPNVIFLGNDIFFFLKNGVLATEFVDFYKESDVIKRKIEERRGDLLKRYQYIQKDVKQFNAGLRNLVLNHLRERREKILNKNRLLDSIGIPLRKRSDTPKSFSVPHPQLKEKIIVKPSVEAKGFIPEPTLDQENYQKILKYIDDVGRNFERMPSLYKGKQEEDLRDHILMVLDPNFQMGSASGETFNKSGKTDIQLRYDSSVVFIAECKFWSGKKGFHATIDQLLNYLTWRDTKAAVVIFVSQKQISLVLEQIKKFASEHPNYVKFINCQQENWFNFRFHLNGDHNRGVQLAVMLYHLPKL